jgi:hypothetical protein
MKYNMLNRCKEKRKKKSNIVYKKTKVIIGKIRCQLHLVAYSYNAGLLPGIFLNSNLFSRP